jgi:16S rRNA (guanine527-N7)-methyltransferase
MVGRRPMSGTALPPEAARRLSELTERYGLDARVEDQLASLLATVAEDPTAPTTVTDPAAGADVHIADSLVGLEVEAIRSAGRIADLGAGAGFPGLALAAALPQARVDLVESVAKKCTFMAAAAERAGIANARAVPARAEEWAEGRLACDVVTARALAPLTALVEYAAPLLVDGGTLVAWKGARDPEEEAGGEAAARITGLELVEVRPVKPFANAEHRHLHVYVKVRETPARFPRRAGMARKRPLVADR